jgi:hypothetical protein
MRLKSIVIFHFIYIQLGNYHNHIRGQRKKFSYQNSNQEDALVASINIYVLIELLTSVKTLVGQVKTP